MPYDPQPLLTSGIGALIGAATELFSPSEYDTVTVPAMIPAVLLILGFETFEQCL